MKVQKRTIRDLALDLENTVYRKKNQLLMITFAYFSTYLFHVRHAYTWFTLLVLVFSACLWICCLFYMNISFPAPLFRVSLAQNDLPANCFLFRFFLSCVFCNIFWCPPLRQVAPVYSSCRWCG
jgi:hypothetical protein